MGIKNEKRAFHRKSRFGGPYKGLLALALSRGAKVDLGDFKNIWPLREIHKGHRKVSFGKAPNGCT
jgi:hypothetical protein